MMNHLKNNKDSLEGGNEKLVNDFLKEFKAAFQFDLVNGERVANGDICEFEAIRFSDGMRLASKGWVGQLAPRLEITGEDFRRLGDMSVLTPKPSCGVISGMFEVARFGRWEKV